MYPDEDEALPLPTLTKWPFYLGDAILVGLAVTIATLDNWQLEGIQIFACVLAVALGAGLLVLPFVTEFLMFAREEKEDRAAELRLFKKQLESLESALLRQHERLNKLESRSGLDDQRYELLTSAIDQKTQVELPELPDLTALMERIEAIEASGEKKTKLSALEESEKQDTASKAVSRIIDPESKSAASDDKTEATDSLKDEVSRVETAHAEKPGATATTSGIASEIDQLPDDFSVSLGADLMMDDDLFEAEGIAKPKKSTAKKAKTKAASEKKATGATSEKPVTATVAVNKLMGVGNKPFLRGSGAGLSLEKGVEMEFQEIGKWTWSATVPANEAVEVQVYRNDKDADRGGKLILKAGQELKITPEFQT